MVERGMDAEFHGDKGKIRGQKVTEAAGTSSNDDAIWAITLAKELWNKRVWCATRPRFYLHPINNPTGTMPERCR